MESVVPEMLEAQADRTPDAQAVAWAGGTLTYAELNARANRLARLLIERGAGPESLVAVLLPRSADLVVALLAVLKAGAAYLPVNPDYPAQRIGLMLDDAQPALVLTSGTVDVAGGLRLPGCLVIDSPEVTEALSRYTGRQSGRCRSPRPAHPAQSRLRAVHLGFDRRAEGCRSRAAVAGQLPGLLPRRPTRRCAGTRCCIPRCRST